jgi:uncharacterized protein YecT (DUF1311 family)
MMPRIIPVVLILTGTLALRSKAQENDLRKVEAQINDTYIEAITNARRTHTPKEVESIKDSESKWRAYRNAECEAEKGGDACLVRMTKERILALTALYLATK